MKSFTITLLLSMLTMSLSAQVNFGVSAGPTLSYGITKTDAYDNLKTKVRPGVHAGFFLSPALRKKTTMEVELKYVYYKTFYDVARHTLYLPLSVKYYPISKWSLGLGPDLGFLAGTKVNSFFINRFELGLHASTSYHINDAIAIDFRYMHGLTNVLNFGVTDENGGVIANINHQNRLFELGLKYKISGQSE